MSPSPPCPFTDFLNAVSISAATRKTYQNHLVYWFDWLRTRNIEFELALPDDLFAFLDDHTWKVNTRHNSASAIKAFYTWKYGDRSPFKGINVRPDKPRPQRTFSKRGLQDLLSFFDTSTPKGIRDLSIVTLLTDTGLRSSELCRIDIRHIDLESQTITVTVKGGNIGQAAYFDYTASCLASWLSIRSKYTNPKVNNLYVGIGGDTPGNPITPDGLRAIFRQIGQKSGLGLMSPHDFRRTFATLSSRAGAPSRIVQVAGRWSSIQMVERYTGVLDPEDMRPYSPINRLMGLND